MRCKTILLFFALPVLILSSCNTNEYSIVNYAEIKNTLLQDSVLSGQHELIKSIIKFYKKELPHQFSKRIMVDSPDENVLVLDTMDEEQIDSLQEHIDALNIRIGVVSDAQIVDEAYLINNIRFVLSSAGKYPWNQNIPDSIFMNYLLPYKLIHEYPGSWWNYLEPYYRDSLSMWSSPSYTDFDATNARWIQRFTTIYPRELPLWWNYEPRAQTFTKYPSLNEILLLKDGGCYLEAMINVMILRSCGIPATIYEVPYWGSRNGSHAGDAFWSSKAQKMITRYEWVVYNPEYYVRPAKVIRFTYRYTGAYRNHIALYLDGEELQIPQMTGDHWYDATADHTTVSDIKIPVSHKIAERMDLGYLYVMNYGEWVPIHYGLVQGDSIHFNSMGRDIIYQAGFYSGGKDYFIEKPFLLDTLGVMRYSNPNMDRIITINAAKINHGKESAVVAGRSYTLTYLDSEGEWVDHGTKKCVKDGELIFEHVPSGAFYFLSSPSDHRQLARMFLMAKDGQQMWY